MTRRLALAAAAAAAVAAAVAAVAMVVTVSAAAAAASPSHALGRSRRRRNHSHAYEAAEGAVLFLPLWKPPPLPPPLPLPLYHRREEPRRRATANDGAVGTSRRRSSSLYQGEGTHYVELWCGTPPQRQTVIVDTGSGATAFPCADLSAARPTTDDPYYNPVASTTFQRLASCDQCGQGSCRGGGSSTTVGGSDSNNNNACVLTVSYTDGGTWSGYEALDTCSVGSGSGGGTQSNPPSAATTNASANATTAPAGSFLLDFACQTSLAGSLLTQTTDGIAGLSNTSNALWYQMYVAGAIRRPAFALCLAPASATSTATTGAAAGGLTLGGTDARLHATPMVYAAVAAESSANSQRGLYAVRVRKVYLRQSGGGSSALSQNNVGIVQLDVAEDDLNGGGVIVDSGTTATFFTRTLAASFAEAFQQYAGIAYDSASPVQEMTAAQYAQLPTILLQLAGDERYNQAVQDNSSANGGGAVAGLAGTALDPTYPLDVIVAIPPEHYYQFLGGTSYAPLFYLDRDTAGGVLGASAMMGHDVYFDVAESRIGWAESVCGSAAAQGSLAPTPAPNDGPPAPSPPFRLDPLFPTSAAAPRVARGGAWAILAAAAHLAVSSL